jgi:hypothetical protein
MLAGLDAMARRGGAAHMPADAEAVVCRVLDRRAPGAAGLPTLLVLDRGRDEVADCEGLVTQGDVLVGFFDPGTEEVEGAGGHAVVRCVHAAPRGQPIRRLVASTAVDGVPLRLVVEPGSRIDAWPLRVPLLEDPYLAARVEGPGLPVTTCEGSVYGVAVPAGLALGSMRVWGYAGDDGEVLPVGFHVDPAFDPRAIAVVVLWRRTDARASAPRDRVPDHERTSVARLPVRAMQLPPAGERLYLVGNGAALRVGAAVLDRDGHLFGVVTEAGPGDAVADSFHRTGKAWALLLAADDPTLPPLECTAVVHATGPGRVELALAGADHLPAGEVFTAGNGIDCPAGLRIGRIDSMSSDGNRLVVVRPELDLSSVSVCRRGGSTP